MFEKVVEILAEQLNIPKEDITLQSEIVKDLGADSIDMVELLMNLEDDYGIKIPEEDFDSIKTVQDCVNEIEKLSK